jgi:hypothetical protein
MAYKHINQENNMGDSNQAEYRSDEQNVNFYHRKETFTVLSWNDGSVMLWGSQLNAFHQKAQQYLVLINPLRKMDQEVKESKLMLHRSRRKKNLSEGD